jgi:transposase-like protein
MYCRSTSSSHTLQDLLRLPLRMPEIAENIPTVNVAASTILRWVVRYVPEFEKCWRFWRKLLKRSVSCDNGSDDGTDLGTGSLQRAAL